MEFNKFDYFDATAVVTHETLSIFDIQNELFDYSCNLEVTLDDESNGLCDEILKIKYKINYINYKEILHWA